MFELDSGAPGRRYFVAAALNELPLACGARCKLYFSEVKEGYPPYQEFKRGGFQAVHTCRSLESDLHVVIDAGGSNSFLRLDPRIAKEKYCTPKIFDSTN
jgi:hypothetical protein